MRKTFDICLWQQIAGSQGEIVSGTGARQDTAFSGTIERFQLSSVSKSDGNKTFLKIDSRNEDIAATFTRLTNQTPPIVPSRFMFNGWVAAGGEGLLLDLRNGRCLVGDALGWSLGHAQLYTQNHYGAVWNDKKTSFVAEIPEDVEATSLAEQVFISAPGQRIYGHWLLDVVPRLTLMRTYGGGPRQVLGREPPVWAKTIIDALQVNFIGLTGDAATVYSLDGCTIPGFLKSGYIVHRDICREAWVGFAAAVLKRQTTSAQNCGTKIFVTRSRLKGDSRHIGNIEDLEQYAAARGYWLLAPEMLSIVEQAGIFSRARVVVGQDGSGLHNVVFCGPEATLGVISLPSRCNLWHASICDALDQKIAYVEAGHGPDGSYVLQLSDFKAFLDQIEGASSIS